MSLTRNSYIHVSLVHLQVHVRSTLMMCWHAYPPLMFNPDSEIKFANSKLILKQKLQVAISERNFPMPNTMISIMFLHFSGPLLGHLTNCNCMWMPLRHSSMKLYKMQMSSSCLTDISPTALRTSRGCREPDQVMYITWHHRCMLHASKSFSPTWRKRSNWMLCLQKAFLMQATTPVQQSSTLSPLPMSVMFQWR